MTCSSSLLATAFRPRLSIIRSAAATTPHRCENRSWVALDMSRYRSIRAAGAEGVTVTRSEDFKDTLDHAIKANRPYLLDVHVDAGVRPPATGTWALPPIAHTEPVFGAPWRPSQ